MQGWVPQLQEQGGRKRNSSVESGVHQVARVTGAIVLPDKHAQRPLKARRIAASRFLLLLIEFMLAPPSSSRKRKRGGSERLILGSPFVVQVSPTVPAILDQQR